MSKLKDHYFMHAGISCFFYLGMGAFSVVLSMYCQDIGLSASQISYIVSFAPLLSIATQPFFGYLADKWKSPRKVSILLLCGIILNTLLFALSKNFWILLITSGITLSFYNAITPLSDRIGVSSPYEFGKIRLWGSVGYALMAQVSGILYEHISPFSNYIASMLGALITIICIYYVSDPKIVENNEVKKEKLSTKVIMKELIHNRPYMIFLLISFFYLGTTSANYNYLSIFIREMGGTATDVGTYQLFATLFEIPMILLTDRIVRRIPFKYIMYFAISVSCINFAWYATLPSAKAIIAVFVFKGFSTILFTMITVRLIILLVQDDYVSTAYGIQSMVGRGLGATIFQLIGGNIIDHYSMTYFYMFLLIGTFISLLLASQFKIKQK